MSLTKRKIEECLSELGNELVLRGQRIDIFIVGGTALALVHSFRDRAGDIDYAIRREYRDAFADLLSGYAIFDNHSAYLEQMTGDADHEVHFFHYRLFGNEGTQTGLNVWLAKDELQLASILLRLNSPHNTAKIDRDTNDAFHLCGELGITSAEDLKNLWGPYKNKFRADPDAPIDSEVFDYNLTDDYLEGCWQSIETLATRKEKSLKPETPKKGLPAHRRPHKKTLQGG